MLAAQSVKACKRWQMSICVALHVTGPAAHLHAVSYMTQAKNTAWHSVRAAQLLAATCMHADAHASAAA